MASPPTAVRSVYTTSALSGDDPQLDSDLFINEEFPVGGDDDDDDLSLDGLEPEGNDEGPPPYYTGIVLCVVSSRMQWMLEIP